MSTVANVLLDCPEPQLAEVWHADDKSNEENGHDETSSARGRANGHGLFGEKREEKEEKCI